MQKIHTLAFLRGLQQQLQMLLLLSVQNLPETARKRTIRQWRVVVVLFYFLLIIPIELMLLVWRSRGSRGDLPGLIGSHILNASAGDWGGLDAGCANKTERNTANLR